MKKYNRIFICAVMAAVFTVGCGSPEHEQPQAGDLAATDSMTAINDMTNTDSIANTDNMTGTNNAAGTNNVTNADNMTGTDNAASTNNVTNANNMTGTDNMTNTDNAAGTGNMTNTDNVAGTGNMTNTDNTAGTDNMTNTDNVAEITEDNAEFVEVPMSRVTVHDPSVVYDNGTYYIFGSHMAWAKSTDLQNWEIFTMNINTEYENLLGNEWESWCKTDSNPELKGNLWAPDVIFNEKMGKYCMYMSVNGDDWNSVIVMLTADQIEGPYEYGGPVVYSGFDAGKKHPAELTDVYRVLGEEADLTRYQSTTNTKLNAIDPCLTYDEEGNLWMSFGSWFGGIYQLKLDEATGLRDYDITYETIPNESDAYYGHKIAGGFGVSGEGSFLIHSNNYYYLFLSYGGLTATGGYQIRVFRSEDINGPYVDEAGNPAVYQKPSNNLYTNIGLRLMGSYDWTGSREIRVSQGHNSAYVTDSGQIFLIYHSRFAGGKYGIDEAHEVRVQQLLINKSGWLTAAPYEYAGETISNTGYSMEEMCGAYEYIVHTPTSYYRKSGKDYIGIEQSVQIILQEDGSVTGELSGSWNYEEGTANMSVTIDGITYEGVFLKMLSEQLFDDEDERKVVMTFTAIGNNMAVWGSK